MVFVLANSILSIIWKYWKWNWIITLNRFKLSQIHISFDQIEENERHLDYFKNLKFACIYPRFKFINWKCVQLVFVVNNVHLQCNLWPIESDRDVSQKTANKRQLLNWFQHVK